MAGWAESLHTNSNVWKRVGGKPQIKDLSCTRSLLGYSLKSLLPVRWAPGTFFASPSIVPDLPGFVFAGDLFGFVLAEDILSAMSKRRC